MKIETNAYQIASLANQSQVVDIIQEAESKLARMTGSEITLIAYSKKGEETDANNNSTSRKEDEPTIAPGMNTHDPLEEKASESEVSQGDSTQVTRLYLDQTPQD
ncbi:hypothetical protein ACP26L_34635 [Paenibacillus sp. S-38]|uniref:hypothetical protein n=1 Tax=Paenibacillus sp. S-38 TaxID=3416710 RepID=UPI003CE7109B